MKSTERAPQSYRDDAALPAFPDDEPVLFAHRDCTRCSIRARVVARHDREGTIRLRAVRSPLGLA
ncbi:MAG: hypothetical protein AAF899_13025 [Pseudomonadota bacterium]